MAVEPLQHIGTNYSVNCTGSTVVLPYNVHVELEFLMFIMRGI